MRKIRLFLGASIIVIALSLNAQAGDMITGITNNPPPPSQQTESTTTTTPDDTAQATSEATGGTVGYVTEVVNTVLQSMLALF